MASRCPRCRERLENPRGLVCPHCGYSLRLPLIGAAGAVLVVVGFLILLVALFWEQYWIELLGGGLGAIAAGMAALLAAGWLLGRARQA